MICLVENKKIKNATKCSVGSLKFKSQLERTTYNTLLQLGFNPQYEPTTFTLWPGFTPIMPFYDKETDSQYKRRIESGDTDNSKHLVLKDSKVIGIRYTPDFYFKYKDINVYIEVKGLENDVYYIKKKLFRHYLDTQYLNTKQRSIFFEIYTKKQLLQAINILKEYERHTEKSLESNIVSTTER